MAQRRSFGEISKLPSGRYRARYTGPDGRRHKAPQTYHSRDDAAGWLRQQQKLIEFDAWTPQNPLPAPQTPSPWASGL